MNEDSSRYRSWNYSGMGGVVVTPRVVEERRVSDDPTGSDAAVSAELLLRLLQLPIIL